MSDSFVSLAWESYGSDHTLTTRRAPVPADTDPARFGEIPGVRNPHIEATPVQLGDIPAPRFGWDEAERDEVPLFVLPYAAQSVTCPKCRQPGGSFCTSTGGGNQQTVATHRPRTERVAGWTNAVQEHAAMLVRQVGHHGYARQNLFTAFEQAAAPAVAKATKPATPKGVRLTEKQAEYIEHYVMRGGTGEVSRAHFSGDHQERQTANALEAKGIIEYVRTSDDHYSRIMRLTPFGWQVYRQHRLIIRRLDDAEVDRLEAEAVAPVEPVAVKPTVQSQPDSTNLQPASVATLVEPTSAERGGFSPGDRVLWAGNNGTVRHGRILHWQARAAWSSSTKTGSWYVEIDHEPAFGRKPNGFKTWFDAADLIREI